MNKRILVLGGDGFCGWPTALHLSDLGYDVTIIDNLSRREIDKDLGCSSLTPIASIGTRLHTWKEVSGKTINFVELDLAEDYSDFVDLLLQDKKIEAIVHFAEQRAAPYSMKTPATKRYTVDNNVRATHNVLVALAACRPDIHLVHLGTMGVYGYGTAGMKIPEGYVDITFDNGGSPVPANILYPANPGSVYHMTKTLDQLMFAYYAKNDSIRITDLHQGIVWGTQTAQTKLHSNLINRFDYDGDYGTVLNRFLMQAAIGYPLTVHGTGGQTRAFIHINDTVRCIQLAIENPPVAGSKVTIRNQMTESHRVRDLAQLIAKLTGASVTCLENPRNEADENDLLVANDSFIQLGLNPTTLSEGLMEEVVDIAEKYKDNVNQSCILCTSKWKKP